MNRDNTVFYSTANSGYIEYAATSLLSIRKYVPDASLYILSSGMSDKERTLLVKLNIGFHETDLSDLFYQTWQYPIDCYYLFAGPEFFSDNGYKYSVYIDGDILCKSNPLLPSVYGISGVQAASQMNDYTSVFGDDWGVIKKKWQLPESTRYHPRINSGIVYFNNKAMKKFDLLKKSADIYDRCVKHKIPRKGDDSLFSLLQYVYQDEISVSYLPLVYNYVLQFTTDRILPIPGLVFFHFSIDKPWKINPYQHEDIGLSCYNPLIKEWLVDYKKINYESYISLVGSNIQSRLVGLVLRTSRLGRRFSRISRDQLYWLEGRKYGLLQRIRNTNRNPIRLYWWQDYSNGIHNFGDEITRDILLKVFGFRSVLSDINDAELAGAGSILELLGERTETKPLAIWGSGFIQPKDESRLYNDSSFAVYAVRGKLTLDRLNHNTGRVSLGDPGLLASIIYPKSAHLTDKIGVVVHYAEKDLPIVKKLRLDSRFMIIDPLDTPESVAKRITSCKLILSSSLHGLIFADSFGIPNAHVGFSKRVTGGDYKFKDYYSATGRDYRPLDSSDIFKNERHSDIIANHRKINRLYSLQKKLVRSFPTTLR